MATKIEITNNITVGDLAECISVPATQLIGELFKNGIMVTVNEKLDFDTAQIIVGELGLDIELAQAIDTVQKLSNKKNTSANKQKVPPRAPVVAVMGHVDHGKTSLLDAIRGKAVVAQESGGITQHISAYQIIRNSKKITFLDTPGHEAFAAIREHGAHLTDIAIIVIAADDGIKPQTLEAIRFAKKAGVKMIVAANKIDKPNANLDRLKQQLAENNMMPEEWGGDTVVLPVSAKTKQGIPELLDMVLLMAEVEGLRSVNVDLASGFIIESRMAQGRGALVVALVESGTLSLGDFIVAGGAYGKVRTLEDSSGQKIKSAGPSDPVVISGLKSLPYFGDSFEVCTTEKEARSVAENNTVSKKHSSRSHDISDSELLRIMTQKGKLQELNVIVRADMQGSLTCVIDSLKTLNTEEVAIRIVSSGIGPISDNDVRLANASNAIIYGFHVVCQPGVKQIALRDKINIREYKVIYELIDDAKQELSDLLAPEVVESTLGSLKIKKVFKTTKKDLIVGGEVLSGQIMVPSIVKVLRNKKFLTEVKSTRLQRGPQEVSSVSQGEECGVTLSIDAKLILEEGDVLEFMKREVVERSL